MAAQKLTFREQIRGFPYGQIFVVCCARLSEPIAFSSLFPYVYFLTRDFHIAKTESDISKYAGYLSSVFALSQVLSAIQWSKFSQVRGRKITIMIGLFGSMLSTLLLGFSTSYYMALLSRSLMGLLNGNLPVLRTVIGEIAVERKHQALAFSTFPLLWNLGCIFGPLIGGALAHPKLDDDYYTDRNVAWLSAIPGLDKLNTAFPYALPNIVVAVFLFISIIILFLFMEETHYSLKYKYDFGLVVGDKLLVLLGVRDPSQKRPWETNEETQPFLTAQPVDEDPFDYDDEVDELEEFTGPEVESIGSGTTSSSSSNKGGPRSYGATNTSRKNKVRRFSPVSALSKSSSSDVGPFSRRQSISLVKTLSRENDIKTFEENDDTKIPWKALRNPMCYGPILANILLNLHAVCFDQFIPVFMSNKVILNKEGFLDSKFPFRISGGLGYSSEEVGKILSVTGFLGILVIIFVYPYVDRNFRLTHAFTYLHWLLIPVYFIYPFVVFALPENFKANVPLDLRNLDFTNIFLYGLSFGKVIATAMLYPLVTFLTHIGSPPKHRAIINSLAITAGSAAKCIAPILGGLVMSFGLRHDINWLFFWTLALSAIVGYFQSFQLVDDAESEPLESQEGLT